MAFIECSFYSNVLDMESSANVILPLGMKNCDYRTYKKDIPVLYLLHGLTEDHTVWMRKSSVERYVSDMNLAVIMPNVHRSFYTDTCSGLKYFTFVSEELPELMSNMFGLSKKKEDNFVAGLSMGGYGAFKIALSKPYRFFGAASLSGAVDITRVAADTERMAEVQSVFGDRLDEKNDLYYLAKTAKQLPHMYQCCGRDDFLYEDNTKYRDFIRKINPNYTYREGEGSHNWEFWDEYIRYVLEWMKDLNKKIVRGEY
ncbi:MAG: esterase family protein [Clostridia bacterium]|nr:esterase family protein [Clostridia bacterium]